MTTAAPSLRPRLVASRPARAAFLLRLHLRGASRRAARFHAGRALVAAGLLGCGLHVPPSAFAAQPRVAASLVTVYARREVSGAAPARSAHVLAQLPRRPLEQTTRSAFAPRVSIPDIAAPRLADTLLEPLGLRTLVAAKQTHAPHSFFARTFAPLARALAPLSLPAPAPIRAVAAGVKAPRAFVMPAAQDDKAPHFPSARFPAFADSQFAGVQELPGLLTPAIVTQSKIDTRRVPVTSSVGGGKLIQFRTLAQLTKDGTARNNVSGFGEGDSFPSLLLPASKSSGAPTGVGAGMKKVIRVPGLSLPPLSQPLPDWMKAASVRVDRLETGKIKSATVAGTLTGAHTLKGAQSLNGQRVAQNPGAAPLKQPAAPVTSSDRLSNQIEVATSTFVVLLTTTDLQTVAVADPSIADVAVVNSRSVLLNGKSPGVTSLVIVDGQKIRQYSVRVTAATGSRAPDIAAAIGIPGVTVRGVKDALVLEGEVANAAEAQRATEIAGVYAAKVINQLNVRSMGQNSTDATMAQMSELLADYPGVKARMAGDTVILTGEVTDPNQVQDAETVAAATGKKVVNLIKLPALSVAQFAQSVGAVDTAPSLAAPGQLTTAAPISVRQLGGQLVLEGFTNSQGDIDLALSAAKRTGLPVVNRLQVRPALSTDQALTTAVAAAIGRPGITVRGTARRLVLEGDVDDTNEAVLAEQVARGYSATVDNLLKTKSPIEVSVDVTIAEITSTDARNLGVQYGTASLTSETTTPGAGTTRTINPAFNQGVAQAGNGFDGTGGGRFIDPFRARINFLVSNNRARILSAPSTTVLSGRTATFQVGGQVPIPAISTVGSNGNTTAIVFKDYGILLDVVPNALANGVVTLRVRTEVSQPDFANGVTPPGGGSIVPGFQRRSTVTEVTVPPSGVLSLSGLITNNDTKSETGVPILSRIPIIGSLFRSRQFQQNKTELVIFVRPHVLPNPLSGTQNAYVGVTAVGNNTNIAAQLGNPGINSFNGGNAVTTSSTGGAQ